MLGYHAVSHAVRFCNDECLKHYQFHRRSSPTQFLFHKKPVKCATSDRHFLSVFCGLIGPNLERNKIIANFYCEDSQNNKVYVLLQVRSVPKQRFLALYLSDDFLPASCLPESVPLTDDDKFIITGLELVMKEILSKLDLPCISTCVSSILSDCSPTVFQEEPLEVPPMHISISSLPNGFKFSEEDHIVVCPHPYSIVLHKTKKTYMYILAEPKSGLKKDSHFVVLFYHRCVDCAVKTAYAIESSLDSITLKNVESSNSPLPLSNYEELIVECCKQMVHDEVMSMLQESGFSCLEDFVTNFR